MSQFGTCGVCGRQLDHDTIFDPPTVSNIQIGTDADGRPIVRPQLGKPLRMDPETGAVCWCPQRSGAAMSDNWKDSPNLLAAAFESMAENPAFPIEERLGLALQAIRHLHEHIDALKALPQPTTQDLEVAANVLESAANDQREPERYRNWYGEAERNIRAFLASQAQRPETEEQP